MNLRLMALLWLGACLSVLGNGGGYYRGGVVGAGGVVGFEPKETGKVRIMDEKLVVSLGPSEATVEVRYVMKNVMDGKAQVRFGFPVEESTSQSDGLLPKPIPKESPKLEYCLDYQIEAGGSPLEVTWEGERRPANDRRFRKIAGWMISELGFEAGEEKVLKISYRSIYPRQQSYVGDYRAYVGEAIFRYRLSTGAAWAGTIAQGRVELRSVGMRPDELRVIKPVNRFRKDGVNWVWEFKDLDPTLDDDLVIEARPSVKTYLGERVDGKVPTLLYLERGEVWEMRHSNYEVRASSVLPAEGDLDYGTEHLRYFADETAWSEGAKGSGAGEWLELIPKVAKPLVAIAMQAGYSKNDELFKANARPKKMTLLLNDEYRLVVDVPDINGMLEYPVTGYDQPVSKLRITIDEVWPGESFEDLCISYIGLHVRLDKKPKLQPIR